MVKVSLKIQADDSFPRIINWKIHFLYIGEYILGSLLPPHKSFFLSTWCRDAAASLDIEKKEAEARTLRNSRYWSEVYSL